MSSWARVGMKCVCVDANSGGYAWLAGSELVEKQVYTIERVGFAPLGGEPMVWLKEVKNRFKRAGVWYNESGYYLGRFRPVTPKTQSEDVAIFAPLLNTKARESVE